MKKINTYFVENRGCLLDFVKMDTLLLLNVLFSGLFYILATEFSGKWYNLCVTQSPCRQNEGKNTSLSYLKSHANQMSYVK